MQAFIVILVYINLREQTVQHIGFTGTRKGLTPAQKTRLQEGFQRLANHANGIWRLHHGDCVGADATAHQLAKAIGGQIEIWPPINPKYRAWCENADKVNEPDKYLTRNKHIVNASSLLVAATGGEEELRSGTWSTIRYAKEQNKLTYAVFPNGEMRIIRPTD